MDATLVILFFIVSIFIAVALSRMTWRIHEKNERKKELDEFLKEHNIEVIRL